MSEWTPPELASKEWSPPEIEGEWSPPEVSVSGRMANASRKLADVASRLPVSPISDVRAIAEGANLLVEKAVPMAIEKATPIVQAGIESVPEPVKAGLARQAQVPGTPIWQAKKGLEIYEKASRPSREVSAAAEQFLQDQGVTGGWASIGGMVAGAPLDPLAWLPIGKAAGVAKPGLTAVGKAAAKRTVASMVERPGEKGAAEVAGLLESGNLRAAKALIDSGTTNLALSSSDSALLEKTIEKADQVSKLWQTRNALRSGTAELTKTGKLRAQIENLEGSLASEIVTPYGKRVDDLIRRRDAIVGKSALSGEDYSKQLKILNKRIDAETKIAEKSRQSRIDALRTKIAESNETLEAAKTQFIKDSTKRLKERLVQYGGLKQNVKERLASPLEDELIQGIVQMDDGGFLGAIRRSFGDLTGMAEKMDDLTSGAFTRYVWRPQVDAENKLDDLVTNFRGRLRTIQETAGVKSREDDTLFRMFREGQITAPDARKAAFEKANGEYQALMDELLDRYNAVAIKNGSKKIIIPREQYVFHTRKMNSLFDLTDGNIDELSKDAKSMLYVKHNDPIFHSWKRRFDAIPESQLAGAFEAADKYANYVARYEAYTPMAKKFRALSRASFDANKKNLGQYFGRVADNLTGDAISKSGKGLEEASGGVLSQGFMNQANRVMSNFAGNAIASFSSGINQIAGSVNNAIYGGIPRAMMTPVEGLTNKIFNGAAKALVDENYWAFALKNSKIIKAHMADLPERFLAQKDNLLRRTTLNFFKNMNDAMNVGTFNQMYKGAIASGYEHKQAVQIADDILAKTQAIYRDAFRPSVISKSSALGRMVSPLSTYVYRASNALVGDVLFGRLSVGEKAAALARVWTAGVLVNAGVYAATGKRPFSMSDMVPFLRMFEIGPGVGAVVSRAITRAAHGQYAMAALEPAALLLPGGSRQIVQTISGARAIAKGQVEGPVESAKALLFGPPYRRK